VLFLIGFVSALSINLDSPVDSSDYNQQVKEFSWTNSSDMIDCWYSLNEGVSNITIGCNDLLKTDSILKAFVKYSKEQEGIRFLKIKSAKKLSEVQMKEIIASFGKNVEVESFVDESLIGGVVVQEGNTVLDGSIKTQLKKLEHKLI